MANRAVVDESIWREWQRRNRAEERARAERRTKLIKVTSIIVLSLTIIGWSRVSDYDIFVRFAVSAGAVYILSRDFAAREYFGAVVFGALAVLFNPVVRIFDLSGPWSLLLALTGIAVLIGSLALTGARLCMQRKMQAMNSACIKIT